MQARRTRTYRSTLYILHTFHRVASNSIEGGGWSSFQAPLLNARLRLTGPLLLRPLHGVKKRLDGTPELLGLDKAIDDSDLQTIAGNLLEPVPQFSYQPIRRCGVLLGLLTIPRDQQYPVAPRSTHGEGFVEGTIYFRHGSRNSSASTREQERIWAWFHGRISPATFDDLLSEEALSVRNRIDADALLFGLVQALGLTSDVEEAQSLAGGSPADAAELYAEVAQSLRERFPGYADRFERLRAAALKAAGTPGASHNLLMTLAIREVFERAEPQHNPLPTPIPLINYTLGS